MINSPLLTTPPSVLHSFGTRHSPSPLRGEGVIDVVTAVQVHGTEVLFVESAPPEPPQGFDILMTDRKGIAVGVKTADCLPILMVEPVRGIVAAVHAGWRGTLKQVVQRAIREIVGRGGDAKEIYAAMGPCIEERCLAVGPEVSASGRFDLRGENFRQMVAMGVRPDRIDRIELCTYCRSDLFYSYRREGEKAGRVVSFIQLLG